MGGWADVNITNIRENRMGVGGFMFIYFLAICIRGVKVNFVGYHSFSMTVLDTI